MYHPPTELSVPLRSSLPGLPAGEPDAHLSRSSAEIFISSNLRKKPPHSQFLPPPNFLQLSRKIRTIDLHFSLPELFPFIDREISSSIGLTTGKNEPQLHHYKLFVLALGRILREDPWMHGDPHKRQKIFHICSRLRDAKVDTTPPRSVSEGC